MYRITRNATQAGELLQAGDPLPFETVNEGGASPFVLVCEHAGRAVPGSLGRLGLNERALGLHIAYDIGAAEVARALSRRLDAPLVLQPYSRLVIDCNRPASSPECIPWQSDGIPIPGNLDLTDAARTARLREIHTPFHARIGRLLDERHAAGRSALLITIHSFTPRLATGTDARPWHLGLLYNRDSRLSERILAAFEALETGCVVGRNVPYEVNDASDFTIPVHGEQRALGHALIEIRNDLIADAGGQASWARLLGETFERVIASQEEQQACRS